MKLQTGGKIFQTLQSSLPDKQTNLQTRTTQKIKNLQCFLYVTTRARHHKKGASEQNKIQARI